MQPYFHNEVERHMAGWEPVAAAEVLVVEFVLEPEVVTEAELFQEPGSRLVVLEEHSEMKTFLMGL